MCQPARSTRPPIPYPVQCQARLTQDKLCHHYLVRVVCTMPKTDRGQIAKEFQVGSRENRLDNVEIFTKFKFVTNLAGFGDQTNWKFKQCCQFNYFFQIEITVVDFVFQCYQFQISLASLYLQHPKLVHHLSSKETYAVVYFLTLVLPGCHRLWPATYASSLLYFDKKSLTNATSRQATSGTSGSKWVQ